MPTQFHLNHLHCILSAVNKMLALAPALLVLAAANVQASPASAAAEALVARGAYGACDPKCTTFDAYYSACTSDAKSDACLAVCTVRDQSKSLHPTY